MREAVEAGLIFVSVSVSVSLTCLLTKDMLANIFTRKKLTWTSLTTNYESRKSIVK